MCPCGHSTKGSSTSGWITTSRPKTVLSRVSATTRQISFVPGGSPGFAEQNPFASTQNISNHGRNVAVSETHIFNDRNINQFTAGFNRIFNHIKSFGDGSCAAATIGEIGIPGANINSKCPGAPAGVVTQSTKDCVSCGLTSIDMFGGYWSLGDRGFAPFQGGTNVFSVSDTFDMIRGKHNIRVGGGFRAQPDECAEPTRFQDGFLRQLGADRGCAADLLLGSPGGAIHDQTFSGCNDWPPLENVSSLRSGRLAGNAKSDVNIGLAWAIVTPIYRGPRPSGELRHSASSWYCHRKPQLASYCICVQGSDGRVGIQFDKTAFEPRIGLAWKPIGQPDKTANPRRVTPFSTTRPGTRAARDCGRTRPFFAEVDPCPSDSLWDTRARSVGSAGGISVDASTPSSVTPRR